MSALQNRQLKKQSTPKYIDVIRSNLTRKRTKMEY